MICKYCKQNILKHSGRSGSSYRLSKDDETGYSFRCEATNRQTEHFPLSNLDMLLKKYEEKHL